MSDDKCLAEFRFYKNDVYNLKEVSQRNLHATMAWQ